MFRATERDSQSPRSGTAIGSMAPPEMFSSEFVEEHSAVEEQMFAELLLSGEPYKSLNVPNTHTGAKFGCVRIARPVLPLLARLG